MADVTQAYTAYCAMPHMKREGAKKPTKAAFKKLWTARRIEANGSDVAAAKGDAPADLAQIIATAVAAALAAQESGGDTAAPASKRKPMTAAPKDAARNGVLWRLNVEGLLDAALAASGGKYITQEGGTSTLTEAFGPLA
jgi:hypothetical protein